jgi:hypothetical protein
MTTKKDFVPESDRNFLGWLSFLLSYVSSDGRLARFGIPEEDFNRLHAEIIDFEEKLRTANNPETRTKAAVQAKNDSRKVVEKDGRMFIKRFIDLNPQVTNADRDGMGLPIYKTGRTPAPIATDPPDAEVDTSHIGRLNILFYEKGHKHRKGKPAGQHGAEIAWIQRDTPPTRWDELLHSNIDTNSPFTLVFENDQRGKTVYFALRWENTRGEKGPWSDIMSAIIP